MDGFFLGLGTIVSLLIVGALLLFMDLGILAAAKELGLLTRAKPLTLFGGDEGESTKPVVHEPGVPDNKQLQRTRPAQAMEPRR